MIVLKMLSPSKGEASISAKIIKKDGRVIDLGMVCYSGPWYKVAMWRISKWLRRRG